MFEEKSLVLLSAFAVVYCTMEIFSNVANKGSYIGFLILSTIIMALSIGNLVLSNMEEEEK